MMKQRAKLQADNDRLNELRQIIERRKKLIDETGYDNRESVQNTLEEQMRVARARYAELQAKQNDVLVSPSQLKVEEEPQQGDHKTKHRTKKSKHSNRSLSRN